MRKKFILLVTLLLTTTLLAGCNIYGSKQSDPSTTAPVSTNSVSIKSFAFNPASITVAKGTTVTWTHDDGAPHTVTTTQATVSFDSGNMSKGSTFTQTFDTPGTYEYKCSIHPSMKGKVIVE